jgi:hypothetical protein
MQCPEPPSRRLAHTDPSAGAAVARLRVRPQFRKGIAPWRTRSGLPSRARAGQAEPLGPPGARNANGDDRHTSILTDAMAKLTGAARPRTARISLPTSAFRRRAETTASTDFPSVPFPGSQNFQAQQGVGLCSLMRSLQPECDQPLCKSVTNRRQAVRIELVEQLLLTATRKRTTVYWTVQTRSLC